MDVELSLDPKTDSQAIELGLVHPNSKNGHIQTQDSGETSDQSPNVNTDNAEGELHGIRLGPPLLCDRGKATSAMAADTDSQVTEVGHFDKEHPPPDSEASGAERVVDGKTPNQNEASGAAEFKGTQLVLLLVCLFVGVALSGYDSSCQSTLIPVITDQFHALKDIGWFQTAYLVGLCALMLVYGRLYSIYSMKKVYISSLCVFIVGSILTTTSPTSSAFIIGRALTGCGAAGLGSGSNIILARSTPLNRRPTYFAMLGGVQCAFLAFSPLIAGSIARYTTWRVCFAIVIPIALLEGVLMIFAVSSFRRLERAQLDWKAKLGIIDWIGLAFQLPMTVCLILVLQWAGTQYPWGSWRIILLLTITGVLLAVFFFTEHKIGENAMLPLRMLHQRTVVFASLVVFCNFAALWIVSAYLPIYFQAIRGATTLGSGLMILPLAVSQSIAALSGGHITTHINHGYPNPNLIVGTSLSVVGTALLTTLRPESSAARWIGFQIIYGLGIGVAFQPPFISVQTVVKGASIPIALVLLSFTQIFGGVLGLSVAQNVFLNKLNHNLVASVPQVDTNLILNHGALGLIKVVPLRYRVQVLYAYNKSITDVLYIPLAYTSLAMLCSFGLQWKSVRKPEETKDTVSTIEDDH